MPVKRSGTIVAKPSGFFARVWVKLPDGTDERRWMDLRTKDPTTARRKLARLVGELASGALVADAQAKATAGETYRSFTMDRHDKRVAAGVVMAPDEKNNREEHIYPTIGDLPLGCVTDDHIRHVLDEARDKGLGWETVRKIRAVMSRDLKRAKIEKLITQNPVQDVSLPEGLKKDKRPFVSLTDAEIGTYLAAPDLDLEVKMASIVARAEGGMRTAEILRWDWSMINTVDFASCDIQRAKTGEVQIGLEVPDVLRPFLRAWWGRAGSPSSGPVFPVRRGRRVGQAKKERGYSFASRLRRDLFRARVVRLPPVIDPKTKKPVPNPADPIYFDTKVTRRIDFHGFRRAYSRALAKAGVNVQQSMVLASHADARQHMDYVRENDVRIPVPIGALPVLDPGLALRLHQSPAGDSSRRRTPIHAANRTLVMRRGEGNFVLSCATLPTSEIASGAVGRRFDSCVARRESLTFSPNPPRPYRGPR